jgi:D-xylose transport system permease protein
LTERGWAWPLSLLAALVAGMVIGFAIALLVARLGIPSFVVTLAFFLALQGAMLLIIGEGGTIPIRDDAILSVMNRNMPVALGWLLALLVIGGFAAAGLMRIRSRRKQGLPAEAMSVWALKVGALAVVVLVVVYLLNQERQRATAIITIQGVPWVVPLVGVLAIVAGILIASRDNSVSPTTGGAQTLLYAVGAAVIGGTSLFGGRGRVYDAVTGGLVVAVIANGLPLVTQQSGTQFIINGSVLLVAASVDAISRRRAAATGR